MKVAVFSTLPPMDYTIHGVLQARILEWVAFPFSRGSFQPRDRPQGSRTAGEILHQLSHQGSLKPLLLLLLLSRFSRVRLCATA